MAATTSQWWRRLVNAYEVKAGKAYLQGKKLCGRIMGSHDGASHLYLL